MKASIITIGDEILIGQIVDTNSVFIAKELSDIGFVIEEKISIADSASAITSTVEKGLLGVDLIVVTGGLGPTKDDMTKRTMAEIFDSPMVNDEVVARHVESLMKLRGVAYNELNQEQSMVPECCTVLFNAHGTAPGMWFERDGRVVVCLPGVPFEMKELMIDEVLPRLKKRFQLRRNIHRTLITSGLAESMLAERIAEWESSLPCHIKLAYLPSPGRVRLRLSAYEIEGDEVELAITNYFTKLEEMIPELIVGYESASYEQIVHQKLIERGQTLAVAESCTGGGVASKFTAMAGASTYFLAGVVSYSNESKERILGVDHQTLVDHGAVSEQVAMQMAVGVRSLTGADFAVATTGIAGPTGGSEEKPVGTVWFGVATPDGCYAEVFNCGTERSQIIARAVATAISMLYKAI